MMRPSRVECAAFVDLSIVVHNEIVIISGSRPSSIVSLYTNHDRNELTGFSGKHLTIQYANRWLNLVHKLYTPIDTNSEGGFTSQQTNGARDKSFIRLIYKDQSKPDVTLHHLSLIL